MSILVPILIFCTIVVVHELGHFFAARSCGVLVEEFAIGMGPKIAFFKKGDTVYSLRLFPIGGFCRLLGEDDKVKDPRSLNSKTVLQRMFVMISGVLMNFALAILVITAFIFWNGMPEPVVGNIVEGSSIQEAGLLKGDRIVRVNDSSIHVYSDFVFALEDNGSKPISLRVLRNEQYLDLIVKPKLQKPRYLIGFTPLVKNGIYEPVVLSLVDDYPAKKAGLAIGDRIVSVNGSNIDAYSDFAVMLQENGAKPLKIEVMRNEELLTFIIEPQMQEPFYDIGFQNLNKAGLFQTLSPEQINEGITRATLLETIATAGYDSVFFVKSTLIGLFRLVTGQMNMDKIAGPIGMVSMIGEVYTQSASISASATFWNMMQLVAMLSANLGVFNLLPLPALDGGRIVFLTIEAIRKKPIDPEKEGMVHLAGFALLILFAIFVAYSDVMKRF